MSPKMPPRISRIVLLAAILLAFGLGLVVRGGGDHPSPASDAASAPAATEWTCSMHPQIRMPDPGLCPICAMDLIPVAGDGDDAGTSTLTLSESARRLAAIRTSPVERRAISRDVRAVGTLEAAEPRVREVTGWVDGRIERLHVDFTGAIVRAGEPLFDLYSPALYAAQEELIQTRTAVGDVSDEAPESGSLMARTLVAVRERLRLFGLTDAQIREIERQARPSPQVAITAPIAGVVVDKRAREGMHVKRGDRLYTIADLSELWLHLEVYEIDLPWLAVGQKVAFRTDAYPGEVFRGSVAFIDPIVGATSRTARVRVEVPNPGDRLKPGMFVRADVEARIGADGETPLVVPTTAPLVTGTRAVVYVADATEAGRYHLREVELGPRGRDDVVVRDGLQEGERVVSNGAFKIDSELQIRGQSSMMSPPISGAPEMAIHAEAAHPVVPLSGIPATFRAGLDDVLALYFDLSEGLSHDDLPAARAAARRVPDALATLDGSALPDAARHPWHEAGQALARYAGAVAGSEDINVARDVYYHLSEHMIEVVRRFGTSGRQPVLVYHCPMADQGRGADWLQRKPGVENPYYGSQMFRCGEETQVLVAPDAGGDR